MNNTKINKFWS